MALELAPALDPILETTLETVLETVLEITLDCSLDIALETTGLLLEIAVLETLETLENPGGLEGGAMGALDSDELAGTELGPEGLVGVELAGTSLVLAASDDAGALEIVGGATEDTAEGDEAT